MAEKEYIEREAVINHIDFVVDNSIDTDYQKAAWGFGIFVSRLPAADVEPVRHGHWMEKKSSGVGGIWDYYFVCSVCEGSTPNKAYVIAPDFCPNCGAKMDG